VAGASRLARFGERGRADLADYVVEFAADRLGALPGGVCGQAFGSLEAEPGVKQAGGDRVEQPQVLLPGNSGDSVFGR